MALMYCNYLTHFYTESFARPLPHMLLFQPQAHGRPCSSLPRRELLSTVLPVQTNGSRYLLKSSALSRHCKNLFTEPARVRRACFVFGTLKPTAFCGDSVAFVFSVYVRGSMIKTAYPGQWLRLNTSSTSMPAPITSECLFFLLELCPKP